MGKYNTGVLFTLFLWINYRHMKVVYFIDMSILFYLIVIVETIPYRDYYFIINTFHHTEDVIRLWRILYALWWWQNPREGTCNIPTIVFWCGCFINCCSASENNRPNIRGYKWQHWEAIPVISHVIYTKLRQYLRELIDISGHLRDLVSAQKRLGRFAICQLWTLVFSKNGLDILIIFVPKRPQNPARYTVLEK